MRTLPIRVVPIDGEALDSWLEALAHRNRTRFSDMLTAVGLCADRGASGTSVWSVSVTGQQAAAVSTATGATPQRLSAMTLDHYAGRALRVNAGTGTLSRAFPWSRARGSRFCPPCLDETNGRWQLPWRLGWTFACLTHQCLLADHCPRCGQLQRVRPHVGELVPRPGHCAAPAAQANGRGATRCGALLADATAPMFGPDHPVMNAQRLVDAVIDAATADFGVYATQPVARIDVLADIRAIAGRALAYATEHDLGQRIPADLFAVYSNEPYAALGGDGGVRPAAKPGLAAPASAAATALGVIIALHTLAQADIVTAGQNLRWLITSARDRGLAVRATNIGWGRGISPVLTGIQLAALEPVLSPGDQLRYRIGTALPRHPDMPTRHAERLARRLPVMLWPVWSLRLTIPGCRHRQLQSALSAAVLMVGGRLTPARATSLIGSALDGRALTRVLQLMRKHQAWPAIRDAIIAMRERIRAVAPPIDYQRRRQLDCTHLLPDSVWEEIRSSTNALEPGVGIARGFLYEQLTGSPVGTAADGLSHRLFHRKAYDFPIYLTAELNCALKDYARTFFADNGIDDEPLTWQPSATVLDGLPLPVVDPAAVDIGELHRLLRTEPGTLRAAAAQLGSSSDVLRYLLSTTPPDTSALSAGGRAAGRAPRTTATATLPRERLVELYHGQGMSLQDIATDAGLSRQALTTMARDYGIDIREPHRPLSTSVDRVWLHEQYHTHRRTLPDIAREAGMSTTTLARWARKYGIPLRGRGGLSHAAAQAADSATITTRNAR